MDNANTANGQSTPGGKSANGANFWGSADGGNTETTTPNVRADVNQYPDPHQNPADMNGVATPGARDSIKLPMDVNFNSKTKGY